MEGVLVSRPGIVTGPRSPHLAAYLHIVARKNVALCMHVAVAYMFDYFHACGVHGMLYRFVFERRRFFRVLLRPFFLPWCVAWQNCSTSCSLDRLCRHRVCARWSLSTLKSAWAACEPERLTRKFRSCAEHRLGSSPSVLSKVVWQQRFRADF